MANAADQNTAKVVLGGGCFWCTEAVYKMIPGVLSVTSGYAGGTVPDPTYEEVCTGRTGHAEVIQIEYDPSKTNFRHIVDMFWDAHDPTTLNRQGADEGTQYRSVVFYQNDEEKKEALASRDAAQSHFKKPIVTEFAPLAAFYPAEKYHQDFYEKNPSYPYSQAVIKPKVEKFQEKHETVK